MPQNKDNDNKDKKDIQNIAKYTMSIEQRRIERSQKAKLKLQKKKKKEKEKKSKKIVD